MSLTSPPSNSLKPIYKPAPLKVGTTIIPQMAWLAALLLVGFVGWIAYLKFQHPRTLSPMAPDASAPFQGPDRAVMLILAGVFFSILASKLFLIANFGSEIPFWDQWASEARNLLIPFLEGRFRLVDLFSPHNEHRIALTRLLVLGLFVSNGQWDPLVSMVVQAALHALILTFLVGALRSILDSKLWRLFAFFTALLYIIPFSWENTLWGFQSCFYFVLLTGLLGIWLTWKCVDLSFGWWFGWATLLVGLFALGSGILAPAAVLAVGMVRIVMTPAPRKREWAGLVAVLLLVLLAVRLLVNKPGHDHLKAQSVSNFFEFFFQLVAWPTEVPWLGLVLQLPVVGIGLFVLFRRPPRYDPAWFLATLGFWSALSMAAMAYGRANGGMASRYTDSLAFGVLVSLACALWFCCRLTGMRRLAAQMLLVVQVMSVAGGLLHEASEKFVAKIIEKKALEPIQAQHLMAFLTTDDVQYLTNKPRLHIPYPSAPGLAQILRVKKLREVLPSAVHPGLSPIGMSFNENNFIKNGGVYPTTKPANPRLHFGSYTNIGNLSTGEMRLDFPTAQSAAAFQMLVAGYPLSEGMRLVLVNPDGKQNPIQVKKNPKETWHEVIFQNPGTPFSILAVDSSQKFWLAFSQPVPIGRLSIWTKWLLANLWIFGAAGAGCFVAGFFVSYSYQENQRFT